MAQTVVTETPQEALPLRVVDESASEAWRAVHPPSQALAVARLLRGRPLEPYADLMVATAAEFGVDWRLMPIIAVLESNGGVAACGGNAWGWGSCLLRDIPTFEEGILVVGATLAAPPYTGAPYEAVFCLWVSGDECRSLSAVYLASAMYLTAQLDAFEESFR